MRKVSGWRTEHPLEFAKLGLRYGVDQAPEKVSRSPWYSTLCPREADVLIAACKRKEELEKEGKVVVCADIGQDLKRYRLAVNDKDMHFASTPSMITWLFALEGSDVPPNRQRNRLLIGQEALSTHGIPWEKHIMSGTLPNRSLIHMGGNAFGTTIVAAHMITVSN